MTCAPAKTSQTIWDKPANALANHSPLINEIAPFWKSIADKFGLTPSAINSIEISSADKFPEDRSTFCAAKLLTQCSNKTAGDLYECLIKINRATAEKIFDPNNFKIFQEPIRGSPLKGKEKDLLVILDAYEIQYRKLFFVLKTTNVFSAKELEVIGDDLQSSSNFKSLFHDIIVYQKSLTFEALIIALVELEKFEAAKEVKQLKNGISQAAICEKTAKRAITLSESIFSNNSFLGCLADNCMNQRTVAHIPCGEVLFCHKCFEREKLEMMRCYQCHTPIEGYLIVKYPS